MKKQLRYTMLGAAGIVLSSFGTLVFAESPQISAEQQNVLKSNRHKCYAIRMGASWAQWYRSLSALKASADIGVVATVSEIGDTVIGDGPAYHSVTVSVERAIHQKNGAAVPTLITFKQSGGVELDGVAHIVEDDPLFRRNERVILFFQEYESGRYRVAGGPTGRYNVDDAGTVSAVVEDGIGVPPGTSIDAFASM